MPYSTLYTRTKAGTSDDASPNSSAPASDAVAVIPAFAGASYEKALGWVYYLVFFDSNGVEVEDASANVTPWVLDESTDSWAASGADERVGNRELYKTTDDFRGSTVFFQLTEIAGATVTSIQIRVGSY